jgi:hypothetical protein
VKTQIIQLEPHDDTISVRDKMVWSQTGRVVLVWPARGRLLDRRLDLVLLLRHSQSLGAQVALVTTDPEVRFQAHTLGIPVYKSVRKAQKSRWKRPRRSSFNAHLEDAHWQDRLQKVQEILADPLHRKRSSPVLSQPLRIGLFALAVLAVLSIAAVLIPSAEISLSPATKQHEITLTVQASDSIDKVTLSGVLPIRWANTIVEGRGSLQTTGSINIPTDYATGEVVFQNLTDRPVIIPEGTVVSTTDSSHRYITLRETRAPAGAGKEVETPIQAIIPGSTGNLSTGRITAIEGDLGVFLTVQNNEPVSGGNLSPSPAPAERDRLQLKEQLIATLTESALQEIQDSLEPEDDLLTENPDLVRIVSESYSPADRQPASELELILRLEFEAPYLSAEDVDTLANAILEANIPEGYSPITGTMNVRQLTSPIFHDGSAAPWRIRLTQDIQSDPSIDYVVSLSLGRSPQNAGQLLMENLSLATPPQIETTPYWWPVMPLIPIRIDVTTTGTIQAINSSPSGTVE